MTSRRIPISSARDRNQQPAAQAPDGGRLQSSLDLVFSFSRSAAFFGENLPSGPSFVDPNRFPSPRPRTFSDDDDDDEGLNGGPTGAVSSDRGHATTTTTDDTDDDHEHDDEPWSGDELDEGAHHSFDGLEPRGAPGAAREQLPPNAVGRGRTSSRRVSTATRHPDSAAEAWRDKPVAADERTPLLPGGGLTSPSSSHISPYEATEGSAIAFRDDGHDAVHPAVAAIKGSSGAATRVDLLARGVESCDRGAPRRVDLGSNALQHVRTIFLTVAKPPPHTGFRPLAASMSSSASASWRNRSPLPTRLGFWHPPPRLLCPRDQLYVDVLHRRDSPLTRPRNTQTRPRCSRP